MLYLCCTILQKPNIFGFGPMFVKMCGQLCTSGIFSFTMGFSMFYKIKHFSDLFWEFFKDYAH